MFYLKKKDMDPLSILLFLLLFALSALFSGSEIAFMSLPSHTVQSYIKQGRKWARLLKYLKENQQKLLITILVGNNLVNTLAAAIATKISIDLANASGREQSVAIGVATWVITILVLLFGEIFPKTIATRYADTIALSVSPIYVFLMKILFPVVFIIDWLMKLMQTQKSHTGQTITDEEIEAFIDQWHKAWLFEKGEYEKLKSMLDFYEVTVQEVMTPRVYIDALPANITVKEAIARAMKFRHSRIPIYDTTIDNIQWMITTRDLLHAKNKEHESKLLSELQLIQPLKVPLTKPIHTLLELFRKTRQHIAIVMDEYGGVAGIVSLEDVVEEVFGDIQDEVDNEKVAIVKDGNCRRVQWFVMLTDVMELLHLEYSDVGISEEAFDGETVSYFVTSHLEKLPSVGEQFILDVRDHDDNIKGSILFEILEVQNNAINEVRVCKQ